MPLPNSDRALRRIAADLAALHADDLTAIVRDLDPDQRDIVERLVREYTTYAERPSADAPVDRRAIDVTRLSPWLIERLNPSKAQITPRAQRALHDCAAQVCPLPIDQKPPSRFFTRKAMPTRTRRRAT